MTLEKAITDIFVGATEHSSGVAGLVPAPDKGNIDSFLRSDGSWVAIDKMDIYQGNGIEITEENDKRIIGVKIADTDTHLISDENGLSINLDEYALNSEAKANNGIRYINQIEIDKLNKLVIEDGDITVSGSIEAAQVKNLYTVVENIITGTSVTEDLDPDTEGIQPAFRIEKGAEVNKINSVSNEFSISNTRVLSLNSIPQSKVIGLSDDIAKINKNVQALDKILNGYTDGSSGVEFTGLVARVANLEEMATSYVTITDFNSVVGDLAQMKNNNINIMNDIDALQQALTWNSLDTII